MAGPSNSYAFAPSGAELILYAYSLCGVRRTAILQEHLFDARMAMNLMLAAWGNETPNLWTVDLVVQPLTQGVDTYAVDPSTVMILDAYIRMTDQGNDIYDRIIWPISRTEYASYPDKSTQAPPTTFWFDRLLTPTVTLWPVPDGQGPYELRYYRCTQIQDANLANGETVGIPQRWYDAFAWGLAARLAVSYQPEKAQMLQAAADKSWSVAATQDVENTSFFISPGLGSYYRGR